MIMEWNEMGFKKPQFLAAFGKYHSGRITFIIISILLYHSSIFIPFIYLFIVK